MTTKLSNIFIAAEYELYVGEGEEKELMEKAGQETPFSFITGLGLALEDFEKNLIGLNKGDKFEFSIPSDKAYGDYNDDHCLDLPRDIFMVDGKFDDNVVREGAIVPMVDSEGNRLQGLVLEIKADSVRIDFNHPLAGEELHFTGTILDTHEATAEEIAALTAPSCGCGCGSHGCDDGDCGSHGCGDGCCG